MHKYENSCPKDKEPDFLKGYQLGRQLQEITEQIDDIQHDLEMNQMTLDFGNRDKRNGRLDAEGKIELEEAIKTDARLTKQLNLLKSEFKSKDDKFKAELGLNAN